MHSEKRATRIWADGSRRNEEAVITGIQSIACGVFTRVVCAVERSDLSFEAVRQASLLTPEGGQIELVGIIETRGEEYSAYGAPADVSEVAHSLAGSLTRARALCPRATTELLYGPKVARLLDLLEESDATLVVVGAGSRHRGLGMMLGDVATEMLHRARSSVLVARATSDPDAFPRSIVVGFDGSSGARDALSVAFDLADRFGASLRVVTAGDAAVRTFDELAEFELERDKGSPVAALLAASGEADLVVVGSRALHGLSALGSVSERVGHQASCPVLVVRAIGGRVPPRPGS
jgi:nucleotide-binding universal stress UspA family protein